MTRPLLLALVSLSVASMPSPVPGQSSRTSAAPEKTVLFVCEHGTVKSLLAKTLFEQYAREAGLNVRAESRGTHADSVVPPWMVKNLAADGLALGAFQPKQLGAPDLAAASFVVSFDVPQEATAGATASRVQWDGLPSVTQNYAAGRDAIKARVRQLVDSLKRETSQAPQNSDWTEPFPPFKIAGNLYYVGSRGLASYLITTPQGHILINSDLEANVPMLRTSVEQLGFKFTDIKILLISHAHWDHDAGSAAIKSLTGAKYMVMDADVSVVESGGKTDFQYANTPTSLYPATKVDRVLHDGDEVRLGNAVLVAHLTPGHTKGCTTWAIKLQDGGKAYDAVIVGSPNVNPGYKLVNNAAYPQIESDYEKTFRVLKALPCDIFLGAHGGYFNLDAKYPLLKERGVAAFVDPAGYKKYVADRERAYRAELARQKKP